MGTTVNRGSEWRRWEPHIHAPGTVLNNQFGGTNAWTNYLTALETAAPKIEAITVTDYYVTDTYEEVLRQRLAGRLPDVQLIFPNIEVRLDVAARSGFVNLHLLVSPEDPDHLVEVRRILTRLQFDAHGDRFDCTREELIRLGKRAAPTITDNQSALTHGATQFKVNFAQLREVFSESDWAKKNILIAVAGGADDGTSGMRQAADATLRQEIERFSHIIFASSQAQREFWLGQRSVTVDELRARYNGCKPCLHGSDAHDQLATGQPVDDRFSWIKGALTFDALRQACIDPGGRAYVGAEPPHRAMPSQVISQVEITQAPWAVTPRIPLNPGLVAIVGARGSGKTALTDVIAAGCDAIAPSTWDGEDNIGPSFLARAGSLIGNANVTLTWGGGNSVARALDGHDANSESAYPRAQYLSQQFVEELCSSKGASEGLIQEIERVIFEAQPEDQLEGATNFAELLESQTSRFQQSRQREAEAISSISERIAEELEKEGLVETLTSQVAQKQSLITGYNADLAKLVVKGTEAQAKRHAQLGQAAQILDTKIQNFAKQRRTFVTMQDEVKSMRATTAPEMLREVRARYPNSGLNPTQWNDFLLVYKGDVDEALAAYIVWVDQQIANINGIAPPPGDPNVALIGDAEDLSKAKVAVIKAEMLRLEKFISADTVIQKQYAALASRISQENKALTTLQTRLTDAKGAATRRKDLQTEREAAYGRVFDAIISEQSALMVLYAPLVARLASSSDTLRKLSFSVSRVVDANAWAEFAESQLIDCRKKGPFYGLGALTERANSELKPAWETGSPVEIQAAMTDFIAKYWKDLLKHAPYVPTQKQEFRAWSKQFAQWLFGTDHITVRYEMTYDGVDIRKLSPGTRGIVLLLLYLALDSADDRPLIIDQPEENLDPKSVFDELVSLFITAKSKRQVIMVTHNANLVINTDADQIIIASAGSHPTGGLPPITYVAGGLEDADIRKAVCDILEGGEHAFRERARRLRVRLDR
ncbi:MAG TPA: AAA family ATPase [Candidatus Acidoferrales bacterium]|nr:AAA family ATPase [Candidatus Acidoferrales bacterium]